MAGVVEAFEPRRRWEAVERRRANEGRGGGASAAETRGERDGDGESEGDAGLGDERRSEADRCLEDMAQASSGWPGKESWPSRDEERLLFCYLRSLTQQVHRNVAALYILSFCLGIRSSEVVGGKRSRAYEAVSTIRVRNKNAALSGSRGRSWRFKLKNASLEFSSYRPMCDVFIALEMVSGRDRQD